MTKSRALFLINPISGTRSKEDLPDLIKANLDLERFDYEIYTTRYKGEASEVVKANLNQYDYFIAVGGDGTVNEIGKELVDTSKVMGIIPIGSGNGLARHCSIPLKPVEAIRLLNKQNWATIDYGKVNGSPFFCTCGVGFDALIGEKFANAKGRGLTNYVKATIKEYFNYKAAAYDLELDDHTLHVKEAFLITFANASQYGNDAFIAPQANIQDGMIDICILSPFNLMKAPGVGWRMFSKNLASSSLYKSYRSRKVVLNRSSEGALHFDGEPCLMGKRIEIELIPNGLKIVCGPQGKRSDRV